MNQEDEVKVAADLFMSMLNELADVYAEGVASAPNDTAVQVKMFNTLRDTFVDTSRMTRVQAANMTRVVIALVSKKYAPESQYTQDELKTIIRLALYGKES